MSVGSSKYSIELWSQRGLLLVDLSGRAKRRSLTLSRNEAEDITWEIDLNEFEAYCRSIGESTKSILIPGQTEVRVKRLGTYICGGQLVYAEPHINASAQVVTLKATGFLNLFQKRLTGTTPSGTVNETYTAANGNAMTRGALAWSLLQQSQALTNGDYGVTQGPHVAGTVAYDKTYATSNLKDALQSMSKLQTDSIDFEFTYDKQFNTYDSIGSVRPDINFEYPGNITEVAVPMDATNITNELVGLGQGGAGGAQVTYTADDLVSQSNYRLRQDTFLSSALDNSDNGLTDATNAQLAAYKDILRVPALTVDGNQPPYITDYHIGDRVNIKIGSYDTLADINGSYRLERMTLILDDDDNETITLQVST